MRFSKAEWANGSPAIEVENHDHSKSGFMGVLELLCKHYKVPISEVTQGLEEYIADVVTSKGTIKLLMDSWSFSMALTDEKFRDEVLNMLSGQDK